MSFQQQTYHSQVFRNFKVIDALEYRKIVHFYERYEKSILQLDFEEYFEMVVAYTQALFEIEAYRKHIMMADVVIETSISQNITHINKEEIFLSTLFQKAASYYQLQDFAKAEHTLKELIKLQPKDPLSIRLLEKVFRDNRPSYIRYARAFAIFTFLVAALGVAIEVLIIRHFLPDWIMMTEWFRNGIFALGVCALTIPELYHRWHVSDRVKKYVRDIKSRKSTTYK
jgi:tetratricopeptide (TPR) repeat protein